MTKDELESIALIAKKSEQQIKTEIEMIQREYGVSEKTYMKKAYYAMSEEEMRAAAERLRVYRRYVRKVCAATGWDEKTAKAQIKETKERLGITTKAYYNSGYYKYSAQEQERRHNALAEKKKEKPVKTNWTAKIAEASGWDEETAKQEVRNTKKDFGTTAAQFYRMRFYEMNEAERAKALLKRQRLQALADNRYELITTVCGKSRDDIQEDLKLLAPLNVGFYVYYASGFYALHLPEELPQAETIRETVSVRQELREALKEKIFQLDCGELTYADLAADVKTYSEMTESLLSKARRLELWEKIRYALDDRSLFDRITLDMEVMYMVFGFTATEYVMFHFWEKDMEERITYLSNERKGEVLRALNTLAAKQTFDSKHDAYLALGELYGRDMRRLDHAHGYEDFRDFALAHPVFVKKDNYDAMGRGIIKIDTTGTAALKDLYEDIAEDGALFILEELIKPAEIIRDLNPDSVNTVRIVTYLDQGNVSIEDSFMKIGRAGSFVDNGGAGGIMVHVNAQTGVFDSCGIDERGFRYDKHPDHGYAFAGIQLPDWQKALSIAKEAAPIVEGARYVGWDLTYTAEGKWIIVEGNGATQFIGQQGTIDVGNKKRLMKYLLDTGYQRNRQTDGGKDLKRIESMEEIAAVIEYVKENRKKVPYLYVNLRNLKPGDESVKAWYEGDEAGVEAVYLLYYDCLHYFTDQLSDDKLNRLREVIKDVQPKVMMLPEEVGKRLEAELTGFALERNCIIDMDQVGTEADDFKSVVAGREDIVEIADLLLTEEEYSIVYDRDVLIAQMLDRYDQGISRYYMIREDDKIVASCSTYGETDDLAPIGGVIVHKDYRRRGYAADVEKHISHDLSKEGKTRIGFVNDLNTPSLELHKKIGSTICGTYYKFILK